MPRFLAYEPVLRRHFYNPSSVFPDDPSLCQGDTNYPAYTESLSVAQGDLRLEILYRSLLFAPRFTLPLFIYLQWRVSLISGPCEAKAGIHLSSGDHDKFGDVVRAVSPHKRFLFIIYYCVMNWV